MMPHEEWMLKASRDLDSAKLLAAAFRPLTDTAIYHTQQCAEKALKAYLAWQGKEPEKIHDLKLLLKRCAKLDHSFNGLVGAANFINPFSTLFRYPGNELFPDTGTVDEAMRAAEMIFNFVAEKTAYV